MFDNFPKKIGKKRNFMKFLKGRYFLLGAQRNVIFSLLLEV